ncbi:hypothetical protein CEQ21_22785 [Niallia circulans]|uniref:Branched-chain amino acid aminotransferase n=1 Tax=Niallia circulans TaxID=1397 RepID=A0A553SMK5_NIACI|nr:hypothetical protein [Niallia circulans]TRZ38230.1 hypothetical protein CEQ21_22785 [Niallia circulans]
MINKNMKKYLESKAENEKIAALPVEKAYLLENELAAEDRILIASLPEKLGDFYMELANKESDETVKEGLSASFLEEKISLLKTNLDEYLYVETDLFDMIQVDGLTLEVDSVFRKYDGLFGFRAPKKQEQVIRSYFANTLGSETPYSLMFNNQDGLWDVNLPIEYIEGFTEELSVAATLELFYSFMFALGSLLDEK